MTTLGPRQSVLRRDRAVIALAVASLVGVALVLADHRRATDMAATAQASSAVATDDALIGCCTTECTRRLCGRESPVERARCALRLGLATDLTPEVPQLLIARMSEDGDPLVRAACVAAFATREVPTEALAAITSRLVEDESWEVRATCAQVLGLEDDLRDDQVAALLRAYAADPVESVRTVARAALVNQGESALPTLVGALADAPPELRAGVASVLGGMGAAASSARPCLRTLVADSNGHVAVAAAQALVALGDTEGAVNALRSELSVEASGAKQFMVVTALEQMGRDAISAVPALTECLRSSDVASVRRAVSRALMTITSSAALMAR